MVGLWWTVDLPMSSQGRDWESSHVHICGQNISNLGISVDGMPSPSLFLSAMMDRFCGCGKDTRLISDVHCLFVFLEMLFLIFHF